MVGSILALDLAQRTGWALGRPGGVPMTGVWVLPPYAIDPGRCLSALENELIDALRVHVPDVLMVEAPLPPQASRDALSAQMAYEMNGIVRATCYRWETRIRFDHLATIRKAVLGRGTGLPKDAIVAWCRQQGWTVPDHNAADAAVLWRFGCQQAAA